MKIAIMGMGKLGLPVALAIESKGHEVMGYDISPDPYKYIQDRSIPYQEKDLQPLLDKTKVKMTKNLDELVEFADLLFLPVQTPHEARFEGATPIPDDRADFNYNYLVKAVVDVLAASKKKNKKTTLAVISTCLPGTFKERVEYLLDDSIDYVYTPQFIAMGTVVDDYLNPEFNLVGVHSEAAAEKLEAFYKTINKAPSIVTDITTAEGIKVSYNTWITAKTVIANAWGEMSERLGMNFDDIKRAWDVSTKRLWSPRYTAAGMSDGGGCHPRDNIALSYIAHKIGMSHNIWDDLMRARDDYEAWHVQTILQYAQQSDLPIVLLGRAFKPETNIETGSPAKLMSSILDLVGIEHEHVEDMPDKAAIVFVATSHDRYKSLKFRQGSIVIDPFGIIKDQDGVTVHRLGRA